ncbi:MAG: J domain-containing protein [Sphingomonadales bacterium]|nr:J domain-containing protein [Sphingomonadales bacterium]
MAKARRTNDWGFPRWRGYEDGREAAPVKICDRYGCDLLGDRPAPKAPNSPERWYFCEKHAGEYNRNYDYFEGLTGAQAAAREAEETRDAGGFKSASHYGWGGPGDGTRTSDEMLALEILELDPDCEFAEVKKAHRRLAKDNHPDLKPGDEAAAARFQAVQTAYEVLRQSEERKGWKPA